MQGDNSKAGRLGREATVRPTRVDFFFFHRTGFLTTTSRAHSHKKHWGPRQQTKTVNGTRHTKIVKYFFLGCVCRAVCISMHTHKNSDINISLSHICFWFLVSQAFGTNIYTSCTFTREPDTVRQRRWYCVPLSKGLLTHEAGGSFCCSRLVTHRSLHATADWHCLGHSCEQCGKVRKKRVTKYCLCSAPIGADLQRQINPDYQSPATPAARIGPTKISGTVQLLATNWLWNIVHPLGCDFVTPP